MSPNWHTDCFYNLSRQEKLDIFKRREGLRIENMFRNSFGWMMLPFAFVGFILTTLFLITVYRAIRDRRVSRKCYILIFNRSIGDLISCTFALLVCMYVILMPEVNRDLVTLVESVFAGSFWSAMVSYVSLSVIKLIAVWKPFHYREWFTMQRGIHFIILSWVVFILMVMYTAGVTGLVKVPRLAELSGCKIESCLQIMYSSRNYFTVGVYLFTVFVFLGTVLLIQRARRGMVSTEDRKNGTRTSGRIQEQKRFPLWKLALNVATFAGLYLFYVIWAVSLAFLTDRCFWQRNYVEMMTIFAIVRCVLVVRIIADPIISFITDSEIRRGFLQLMGRQENTAAGPGRNFRKNTYSTDYNSSLKQTAEKSVDRNRSATVKTIP